MGRFDNQIATALRLINKNGETSILRRRVDAENTSQPWRPGTPSFEEYEVDAVWLDAMTDRVGGRITKSEGQTVYIPASGLTIDPDAATDQLIRINEEEESYNLVTSYTKTGGTSLGYRTAVNGNWAAIGGHGYDESGAGAGSGAVFMFERRGSGWILAQTIWASDSTAGDNFGISVGFSFDGTQLVVGASSGEKAYIFELQDDGTWTEAAALAPAVPIGDFGWGCSINGDVAVVGNWGNEWIYIFEKSGGSWPTNETIRIQGTDTGSGEKFGYATATDGTHAFASAYNHNSNTGAVYVFDKSGGSWAQVAKLVGSSATTSSQFGQSLAATSGKIAVGMPHAFATDGFAYVFAGSGATWTEEAEVTGPGLDSRFGAGISIDGNRMAVAATNSLSFAVVFKYSNEAWSEVEKLSVTGSSNVEGIGVTDDSRVAVVAGAYLISTGTAHFFEWEGEAWTITSVSTLNPNGQKILHELQVE